MRGIKRMSWKQLMACLGWAPQHLTDARRTRAGARCQRSFRVAAHGKERAPRHNDADPRGCTWIPARCRVVAHTEKLVRDIQNELTVAIERRFGELMGRIDAILPDTRSRSQPTKDFKFSSERDDADVIDMPNPIVRKVVMN